MNTFLFTNKLKAASAVTPDSTSLVYPVTALQDDNAASTWRTDNASAAHNVVIDFGTATAIDTISLVNVNLRSTGTVVLEWNTTDSWASPAGSQSFNMTGLALDPPHYDLTMKLSATRTYRYFRLVITDTGNPDGFYEIGELFLGERVDTATGQDFQSDNDQTFSDPNVIHETEWLQAHVYVRDLDDVRSLQLEWTQVSKATMTAIRVMKRTVKNSGFPFVFAPDGVTVPVESFFVRMVGDFVVSQVSPIHYTVKLALREQARGRSLPA